MPTVPTFSLERQHWRRGLTLVAGVDEVGVGAWAGPVVAGAVIFAASTISHWQVAIFKKLPIRDSKQLSSQQRVRAAAWIKAHCLAWAVGAASVKEIDALNIFHAARLAMHRVVTILDTRPQVLLIDGRPPSPNAPASAGRLAFPVPSEYIVKGDQLSVSIAAASIVAKIHRDAVMAQLDQQFPDYGFDRHKGYGTTAHLAALRNHGPCPIHRQTYAPVAAVLDTSTAAA